MFNSKKKIRKQVIQEIINWSENELKLIGKMPDDLKILSGYNGVEWTARTGALTFKNALIDHLSKMYEEK